VNSIHHQIVNELAPGLKASAWSQDKVIEAFESTEDIPLIIGVQWHPEVLFERDPAHLRAFSDLVQRAENFKYYCFVKILCEKLKNGLTILYFHVRMTLD